MLNSSGTISCQLTLDLEELMDILGSSFFSFFYKNKMILLTTLNFIIILTHIKSALSRHFECPVLQQSPGYLWPFDFYISHKLSGVFLAVRILYIKYNSFTIVLLNLFRCVRRLTEFITNAVSNNFYEKQRNL